jgi:hypothetical protein
VVATRKPLTPIRQIHQLITHVPEALDEELLVVKGLVFGGPIAQDLNIVAVFAHDVVPVAIPATFLICSIALPLTDVKNPAIGLAGVCVGVEAVHGVSPGVGVPGRLAAGDTYIKPVITPS